MRQHDEALDQNLHREIDFPVFQGPVDAVAPALDVSVQPAHASVDGQGGEIRGKPVFTIEQVVEQLNRGGAGWTPGVPDHAVPRDGDVSVLNFGFHTAESMFAEPYVYEEDGQLYGRTEYFGFAPFTEAQKAAAREAMASWDDLIAPTLVESAPEVADITFANYTNRPGTQAYAYLPYDYTPDNADLIAGDVWVSANQPSNFQLDEGLYGIHTLTHESGHALGLEHPGDYNAAPGVSITYAANAEYYQDSRAYSIMSYFAASETGARHFDFNISTTVYASTPLVHDIAAIQAIYGADMTTRTGDTVYGFNSNAGRDSYDFTKTPAPVMAIWDAGGNDTIDASGYATDQIIDLTPGSLSSIGGVTYDTAPSFEQVNANRAAAGYAPVALATYNSNMALLAANPVVGRLTDNVGIAYGATIENAVGGSGADRLIGNTVANTLTGNAGNDLLEGRQGDDVLFGGAGDDVLDGGEGADRMTGGTGDDRYVVDHWRDTVVELAGGGVDTVWSSINYSLGANLENLKLTGQANLGTGNGLNNVIEGNDAANLLSGEGGADSLFGGGGTDILLGGAGADRLNGGAGFDILVGGAGNDIFVFDASSFPSSEELSIDFVADYTRGELFDFSAVDADTTLDGDQAFSLVTHWTGVAGQMMVSSYSSLLGAIGAVGGVDVGIFGLGGLFGRASVIWGDLDGDSNSDFAVLVAGGNVSTTGWLL
ncbi:MAG: M10 family metallopeptidase C-terminal domain-containing protein [Caulobacter sp.]|nr:M10 family metallopeptidase C-terminal domain-containing protein [Caulobacter sp.]